METDRRACKSALLQDLKSCFFVLSILAVSSIEVSALSTKSMNMVNLKSSITSTTQSTASVKTSSRRSFLRSRACVVGILGTTWLTTAPTSSAFSGRNDPTDRSGFGIPKANERDKRGENGVNPFANGAITNGVKANGCRDTPVAATVAYRPMLLDMTDDFDAKVPVGIWYPFPTQSDDMESFLSKEKTRSRSGGLILEYPSLLSTEALKSMDELLCGSDGQAKYNHRISIRRIGALIAGWNFIPDFVARKYVLDPPHLGNEVADGRRIPLPSTGKVVFLAHGYLGSRFDLCHMAEALAKEGFICVSPEYPESLSANYEQTDGLDRSRITERVLEALTMETNISAFGIIGHSLGCGTALKTGDDSWARVLIAGGFGRNRDGSVLSNDMLLLTSMNDGVTSQFGSKEMIPPQFTVLDDAMLNDPEMKLPKKAAWVFEGPQAPNHISFLNDGVNEAMIDLLSPLLPVAQAAQLPVLDFDRYKDSRDAEQTAATIIPVITRYLKQLMGN